MNIERIIDVATDVFGSSDRANEWVDKMSATLGASPRELSSTEEGMNAVLLHLAGISRNSVFDL